MKKIVLIVTMTVLAMLLTACNGKKGNAYPRENGDVTATPTGSATNPTQTDRDKYKCGGVVELADYSAITKPEEFVDVTDEKVEEEMQLELQNYLAMYPNYEKDENHEGTVIANGDTVNIDFVGKIDGVAFEGGSGEDYYLAVGSGQFIEDFEKGMPGHSIGETFDVTAVFPEDYQNDEYAGKTAVFTITANFFGKAKEGADDAYIARISGGMYNSLEEYKAEIKEYMSELAKDEYRSTAYGKVLDEMIAKSNFVEILDADVEYFENDIDRFYTSEAGNYGMSTEDYAMQVMGLDSMDAYLNSIHDQAIQVVKENMITDAIAKKENIVVTQELYEKGMQTYLDQISGATLADLEEYYTKDYLWEIVYQDMVDQKLFDKVSGN